MTLAGKTWFVTGASTGLGKEMVIEVLARGGNAVAAMRNPAAAAGLEGGDRLLVVPLDVTRPEQVRASVDAALLRFGRIDVLVNNAGYGLLSTLEEASDEAIRLQFETNLFGPIALMRACLPAMRAQGGGLVINVSSTAGSRGFAGSGYYSASKAGLEALTEALDGEARDLGIRGMIVAPGPFRTEFFGRSIRAPETEIAAYAPVIAQRHAYISYDGKQQGDPVRAARIIVDAASSDQPPLRLPLGGDSCETIAAAHQAKIDQVRAQEAVAAAADYPPGE